MGKWMSGFRLKMLFMIGIPALVLMGLTVFTIQSTNELSARLEAANNVRIPVTQHVNHMHARLNGMMRYMWTGIFSKDVAEIKESIELAQEEEKLFEESLKVLNAIEADVESERRQNSIAATWPKIKDTFSKANVEIKKNTDEGDKNSSMIITKELVPLVNAATLEVMELNKYEEKMGTIRTAEEKALVDRLHFLMTVFSTLGLLFTAILGLTMTSRIVGVLSTISAELMSQSTQVTGASEGLASAANELSSGATETATSIEETAASSEELNSMVKLSSENAALASQTSQDGYKIAENGQHEIKKLHAAVEEVARCSKKIAEITDVIDDIAFQTNLLALNASVEAARAGEQGKGFAVVAEAVRTLSQRSAVAAKDINVLIKDSVEKINNSTKLATSSQETLDKVVDVIKKVADLNGEISLATKDQATGLGSINAAVNEIDKATQHNAAAAEEISATTEEMTAQASALRQLVQSLNELIDGKNNSTQASMGSYSAIDARSEEDQATRALAS